jgi:hypothetical protein
MMNVFDLVVEIESEGFADCEKAIAGSEGFVSNGELVSAPLTPKASK